MGTYLLQMFGGSLLLTVFIEGLVGFLWGLRGKKNFILVILINFLTNPAAVLIYWLYRMYFAGTSLPVQILIEIVVVMAEALIYRSFAKDERFPIRRPVLLAVVANGLSWGIGGLL
ncbi:MAG: hypothetical protein IJZ82_01500 [Lachnospiraceae bacterium]|nr:hypothetical protein [Lachnospiraceae bacterium]